MMVLVLATCRRLLWNVEPRAVEVFPCDGSIIRSTGHTGHHYIHYLFNNSTRQVSHTTHEIA